MTITKLTQNEFRAELKAREYKLSIKTYSDFKAAKITQFGITINTQIKTPELFKKHEDLYKYLQTIVVQDGQFKVVF